MISQSNFGKRLLASVLVITFFLLFVLGKFAYIQLIDGSELQAKALDQWTRDIPLKAERGRILDLNGVELAGTSTSYTLYVRKVNVKDVDKLAEVVSEATAISKDTLIEKLSKKGSSEITLCRKLTKEIKTETRYIN